MQQACAPAPQVRGTNWAWPERNTLRAAENQKKTNSGPDVAARRHEQRKRWFRNGHKWRTGCEGRISVVKRRHGLNRCRYKGDAGMKPWVGLGVIAV
jgi:IS5 family transposase